jgi:beta-lactam-binding protein with PASTA domain
VRFLAALVVACLGFVFVQDAAAYTRETPSIRLTNQTHSSGAKTASVSIPTGTTNAIIAFYFESTNSNQAPTSVSLDGQSATKQVSAEVSGQMDIATYTVSGFATGAGKTLAYTNGTGYTVLDVAIEFYDSTPTYGANTEDWCTSCGTLTSSALANTSGDNVLCPYAFNGSGSVSGVGAGQTKLDETTGASIYGFTTKAGAGGTTTVSFTETGTGTLGYNCIVITLAASTPTFSAGPTYATVSNTQISATFTASAAALSYFCALYLKGASTPTAAQVAAGTNAHSAVASGSTTGSSESHNITASDSPSNPSYDPYCVLYNGTTYSAVPSTSTKATTAPTGFQYVTLASVSATGSEPKAANDADWITLPYDTQTANFTVGSVVVSSTSGAWGYILADTDAGATGTLTIDKRSGTFADNNVLYDQGGGAALVNGSESAYTSLATSDVLVVPTTVSPSLASLAVDTSGQYVYTANGRQSALNGLIFHDSTQAYLSLDIDAWFNNTAPHCQAPQVVTFRNGATIDYDVSSLCSDPDNDTLSYARITSLPAGATIDPSTGHITGTVTADATTAASVIVYDQAGDYTTQAISITVQTQWPMPNCSALTAGVCGTNILSLTNGTVSLSFSSQCSGSVAAGGVIAQSPAAGVYIAPGDTVTITESVGNICSVRSPDCTSAPTTTSACEALYLTAFSDLVTFASSSRCDNSHASGYVISTSPKAHTEMPLNPNISVVSSLGTCSTSSKAMVNCISHTTAECLGLLQTQFGSSVSLNSIASTCPAGYAIGEIYSQAPAAGKKTQTPAILNVTYCQ